MQVRTFFQETHRQKTGKLKSEKSKLAIMTNYQKILEQLMGKAPDEKEIANFYSVIKRQFPDLNNFLITYIGQNRLPRYIDINGTTLILATNLNKRQLVILLLPSLKIHHTVDFDDIKNLSIVSINPHTKLPHYTTNIPLDYSFLILKTFIRNSTDGVDVVSYTLYNETGLNTFLIRDISEATRKVARNEVISLVKAIGEDKLTIELY